MNKRIKSITVFLLLGFFGALAFPVGAQPKLTLERTIPLEPHSSLVLHEQTNKAALVLPDQSIKILDLSSGKELSHLPPQRLKDFPPNFSADGEKLSTFISSPAKQTQAVFWEVSSGKKLVEFSLSQSGGPPHWNDNCTRLLLAEIKVGVFYTKATQTIKVWDAQTGYHEYTVEMPFRPKPNPDALFSPDGERVLLTDGSHAELREVISGKSIAILYEDKRWLNHTLVGKFSDDSKTLLVIESWQTTIWDSRTGRKVATLLSPDSGIRSTYANGAFSLDDKFVITDFGDGLYLWDAATGKLQRTIQKIKDRISVGYKFSPDHKRIFVHATTGVLRWRASAYIEDLATGNNKVFLTGEVGKQSPNELVWEPKGTAFVLPLKTKPQTAEIWSADSATLRATIPFYYRQERGIYEPSIHTDEFQFNPVHPLLLAQNEKYFRIWNSKNGTLYRLFGDAVTSAAWANNGEKIITFGRNQAALQIWRIDSCTDC